MFQLLICSWFFCICMYIRNKLVYYKLMKLLDEVDTLAQKDIEEGKDFTWRFENFGKVSYPKLLFQIWRYDWSLNEKCEVV